MGRRRSRGSLEAELCARVQEWFQAQPAAPGFKPSVDQCIQYLRDRFSAYTRLRIEPFSNEVQKGMNRSIMCLRRGLIIDFPLSHTLSLFQLTIVLCSRVKVMQNLPILNPISSMSMFSAFCIISFSFIYDVLNRDYNYNEALDPGEDGMAVDVDLVEYKVWTMNHGACCALSQSHGSYVQDLNTLNASMRSVYNTEDPNAENKLVSKSSKLSKSVKQKKRATKKLKRSVVSSSVKPSVRYDDIGGLESVLQEVREIVEPTLTHPEIYRHLGVQPPRGLLLHGPPGCGKV